MTTLSIMHIGNHSFIYSLCINFLFHFLFPTHLAPNNMLIAFSLFETPSYRKSYYFSSLPQHPALEHPLHPHPQLLPLPDFFAFTRLQTTNTIKSTMIPITIISVIISSSFLTRLFYLDYNRNVLVLNHASIL